MDNNLFELSNFCSIPIDQNGPGDCPRHLVNASDVLCMMYDYEVLFVLGDDEQSQAIVEFDDGLVTVAVSSDGSLVIVGDKSGHIHFINPLMNINFHSQKLVQDIDDGVIISSEFSTITNGGSSSLYILLSNGVLYVFKNILITRLNEALQNGDWNTMQEVYNSMVTIRLDVGSHHTTSVTSMCISYNHDMLITCGEGDKSICLWFGEDDSYEVIDEVTFNWLGCILKSSLSHNGRYLITLLDNHRIVIWLLDLLMIINVTSDADYNDFTILHPSDTICCQTNQNISIHSLPDMKLLYSMDVQSSILTHGWISDNVILFAELDSTSPHVDATDNLVIRKLSQLQPEYKLHKLIKEEKFTEAFKLAQKYKLNDKIIHKNKALVVNKKLCKSTDPKLCGVLCSELINALSKVEDVEFVSDIIMTSFYPTMDCTLNVLRFAKRQMNQSEIEKKYDLLEKVHGMMDRLVTFQMLPAAYCRNLNGWKNFSICNLMDELCDFIKNGDVKSSVLIWQRHEMYFSKCSINGIMAMLLSIPDGAIMSDELTSFIIDDLLHHFLLYRPTHLDQYVDWLMGRILRMESTEMITWPTKALEVLESVILCLSNDKGCVSLQVHQLSSSTTTVNHRNSLGKVQELFQRLKDLKFVKTQLNLTISFNEFNKETAETVVFKLLDSNIAPEILPSLIKDKIQGYLDYHSLQLDDVLYNYLIYISSKFGTMTSYEARAITIVKLITNNEVKVKGCLELLSKFQLIHTGSAIEYNKLLHQLIEENLSIAGNVPPLIVNDLRKKYDLLQLRGCLSHYGIDKFDCDAKKAWSYINYVLKKNEENSFSDALKIAELCGINKVKLYMLYLTRILAYDDKMCDNITDVLGPLTRDESINVCIRTIGRVTCKLEQTGHDEMNRPKYVQLSTDGWMNDINIIINCLKFLKRMDINELPDGQNVDDLIQLMKRMRSLYVVYNKTYCPSVLQDPNLCQLVACGQLDLFMSSSTKSNIIFCVIDYMRYGHLMGISNATLYRNVIMFFLNSNKPSFSSAMMLLSMDHVADSSCLMVGVVVAVVMRVWLILKEAAPSSIGVKEIKWLTDLVERIILSAPKDEILKCLQIHSSIDFIRCVMVGSGTSENNKKLSDFHQMFPHYRETGMIYNVNDVLPAAVDCCFAILLNYSTHVLLDKKLCRSLINNFDASKIDLSSVVTKLYASLHQNGHYEIALKLLTQSSTSPDITATDIYNDVMNQLLLKVLMSREKIDHIYGLGLILGHPVDAGLNTINKCRASSLTGYSNVIALCGLAASYGWLIKRYDVIRTSLHYLKSARWGKTLREYQISFSDAFVGGPDEKVKVLFNMFDNQSIQLDLLIKYCGDFDIDIQNTLFNYLKTVTLKWPPGEEAKHRVDEILHMLTDKTSAFKLLAHILHNKLSPYGYGRIELILMSLVQWIHNDPVYSKGLELLAILKLHIRNGPVSIAETNWLKKISTESHDRHVLPFHLLLLEDKVAVIELLGYELNKDSVDRISSICHVLSIPFDNVLIKVLERIIHEQPMTAAFDDLVIIIERVKNIRIRLKMLIEMSARLANEESVKCLKYTISVLVSSNIENPDMSMDELSLLLHTKETEMILEELKVEDVEEYLSLAADPTQLITLLYYRLTSPKPIINVHKVVERLGCIWDFDVVELRQSLANKWLLSDEDSNLNISQLSMMEDPDVFLNDEDMNEDSIEQLMCLKRLSYLMNIPSEIDSNVMYLYKLCKSETILGGPHSCIKAFQVLLCITSEEVIESLTGSSINDLKSHIQMMIFIYELNSVQMNYTMDTFHLCDKEILVRTLLKNHIDQSRALRLIIELCIYYGIHDHLLWEKTMLQLTHMNMIPYLRHVLKVLIQLPLMWKIKNIANIWNEVLMWPLNEASLPLTTSQLKECNESIKYLMICPFIDDINIKRLSDGFKAVGLTNAAMKCATLLPKQTLLMKELKISPKPSQVSNDIPADLSSNANCA